MSLFRARNMTILSLRIHDKKRQEKYAACNDTLDDRTLEETEHWRRRNTGGGNLTMKET